MILSFNEIRVVHTFNPSTQEAEAEESLEFEAKLQSEFQDIQSCYTKKLFQLLPPKK